MTAPVSSSTVGTAQQQVSPQQAAINQISKVTIKIFFQLLTFLESTYETSPRNSIFNGIEACITICTKDGRVRKAYPNVSKVRSLIVPSLESDIQSLSPQQKKLFDTSHKILCMQLSKLDECVEFGTALYSARALTGFFLFCEGIKDVEQSKIFKSACLAAAQGARF